MVLQDLENAPERSRQPRHRWTADMIHPLADQGEGKPASFVARDVLPRRRARRRAPAHLGARALPRLHQRQARRRRPADPGLDLLRQAHRLPDLPGRRRCCGRARTASRSGSPTAGTARRSCGGDEAIFNCWGDQIGALAEIASGDEVLLRTDGAWESGSLPILRSGIYFGEIYDARLEKPPATAGVEVLAFDTGLLVAQECRPVRELTPFPVAGELDRPQGPDDLRFRPERGRLCRLHGARRGGRAGHRRAFRDRRPRPRVRQPQLPLGRGADRVRAEGRRRSRPTGRISPSRASAMRA